MSNSSHAGTAERQVHVHHDIEAQCVLLPRSSHVAAFTNIHHDLRNFPSTALLTTMIISF
jgi:hypothetical protein